MSDNRFKNCETAENVLLTYSIRLNEAIRRGYEPVPPLHPDALARIAELSPRTVTDDQRTRAIVAAIDYRSRPADVLVDRIIDALGYTVAPQPKQEVARDYFDTLVVPADAPHQCADVQDDCCERTPAPATPAVELTPDELRSAAAIVEAFRELHTQTCKLNDDAIDAVPSTWPLPIIDAQLPVAVVCGESDWVLRIGGTDE